MALELRRPGDPPPQYGPLGEVFTVEINYGGFFCGFGASKTYVDGKVARFDGYEAGTWSPLWLTNFMSQLGYDAPGNYNLYWLLPTMNLDAGLWIVDCDTDTLSMIAVVPKFQYFQMYIDHKDTPFGNIFDDINIANVAGGSNVVGSSNAAGSNNAPPMPQNHGHEPRRSRRTNVVEEAARNTCDGSDSSDSEWDSEWVDSDNELAKDDDDLFNEWVDTDFGKNTKKGSKREVDSDYSDDFEEKKDSDNEEDDSAEEVEVVDAQGKKCEKESEA